MCLNRVHTHMMDMFLRLAPCPACQMWERAQRIQVRQQQVMSCAHAYAYRCMQAGYMGICRRSGLTHLKPKCAAPYDIYLYMHVYADKFDTAGMRRNGFGCSNHTRIHIYSFICTPCMHLHTRRFQTKSHVCCKPCGLDLHVYAFTHLSCIHACTHTYV
jgi:hypothetical protein